MAKKAGKKRGKKKAAKRQVLARKIKLNLGGLQTLLKDHKDAFSGRKIRAKTSTGWVVVDDQVRDDAIDAMNALSVELSNVCEQGILAIEIEP